MWVSKPSGTTKVVASGLSFANGVAMSSDEKSIFVAETGKYRIWKVPVAARNLDLSKGPAGGAAIVLGTGTWFFVTRYWGPAIVELVR